METPYVYGSTLKWNSIRPLTARLPVFQWPQTSKVKKKLKVWSEMDELSKKIGYTNV